MILHQDLGLLLGTGLEFSTSSWEAFSTCSTKKVTSKSGYRLCDHGTYFLIVWVMLRNWNDSMARLWDLVWGGCFFVVAKALSRAGWFNTKTTWI